LVHLIDGEGGFYLAKLMSDNSKSCQFSVIEKHENYHKMPYFLHIAIAPTKNIERLEWFLEKSTEIGISEITPLLCEHSERKIVKNDRLERVIISAAKQSVKAFFPKLNSLQEFNLLVTSKFDGEKYIAHCNKQDLPLLKNVISLKGKSLILIGPEGDFSPKEVSFALENGFKEISLGTSRLRTETAGIVACDTVSILNL
jgi:16S rRNA (uracil1498-N3)-methyltransferase